MLKIVDDEGTLEIFKKQNLEDRVFDVKFVGEGSIDDGGPTREFFDAIA